VHFDHVSPAVMLTNRWDGDGRNQKSSGINDITLIISEASHNQTMVKGKGSMLHSTNSMNKLRYHGFLAANSCNSYNSQSPNTLLPILITVKIYEPQSIITKNAAYGKPCTWNY